MFASYSNHPVDGVFHQLTLLKYGKLGIPSPIPRLANQDVVARVLDYVRDPCLKTKDVHVSRVTPKLNGEERVERAQALTYLLKKYEEQVDLLER